jgi:hypothetical protein
LTLLVEWVTAGRGLSAMCTAPPPMMAPPHVAAHNFAKAIRTDIGFTLFILSGCFASYCRRNGNQTFPITKNAK